MNSIIKLTNGETIVAEIAHQDEVVTSVLEPLMLEVGESETGKPMLVAMTWVPLTKKVNMVNLQTQHIVAVSECDDDISEYYIRSLATLKGDYDEDGEEVDEVLEEYLNEVNSDISEKLISANTVH